MYNFNKSAYVYYTNRICKVIRGAKELGEFFKQDSLSLVVIREEDYVRVKDYLGITTCVLCSEKAGHRSMLLISN